MKRFSLISLASLALVVAIAAPVTPTFAKKVSNSTAGSLLTQCVLEDDHHTSGSNSRFTRCCSFTLGYCIECTMDVNEKCEKISIREGLKNEFKQAAPEVGVVAPPKTSKRVFRPLFLQNNGVLKAK